MSIEDQAKAAAGLAQENTTSEPAPGSAYFGADVHGTPNADVPPLFTRQDALPATSPGSPVVVLIRAQSHFSQALFAYIHDRDLDKLAAAQEEFIKVQAFVLDSFINL